MNVVRNMTRTNEFEVSPYDLMEGIVRDHEGLRIAMREPERMQAKVGRAWAEGDHTLPLYELRDLVLVARASCEQAIAEPRNAGTHWNADLVPSACHHSDLVCDPA